MISTSPVWLQPLVTLCSVLLGALLAYFSVRAAEARKTRSEKLGHAYALMFSIQRIAEEMLQLIEVLRNLSRERTAEILSGVKLWQIMPMLFGWDSKIDPTDSHLALVAELRDAELTQDVLECYSSHRVFIGAAREITRLKIELNKADVGRESERQIVRHTLTPEQLAAVLHIVVPLETLADKLGSDHAEATAHVMDTAEKLALRLKKQFGFKHLIGITAEEDEDPRHHSE